MRGQVFDIQRFSLHDGPGIRTTVFLKGCPLRCLWCHNPESRSPRPQLAFFAERCSSCGACAAACRRQAHRLAEGRHALDRDACAACGRCAEVCAFDALRLVGREWDAAEVLAVVERDQAYYASSGGGLTISGGEPLLQAPFTRTLLEGARQRGIHTCLETCGAAPWSAFETIHGHVDLVLFDLKATEEEEHRRLTGVAPLPILSNLERLLAVGVAARLRCPLVPGLNDGDTHLRAIAAIARRHPGLVVEVLPYHDTARHKHARYGSRDPLPGLASAGEAERLRWCETLRALGCTRVLDGSAAPAVH
jgi:pyruvate formate lyase activating enzyme